jgi:hypothetical protein
MNYDNLHTTAEILEAFQGCQDAGEEIDLFEALAWRDEPPVEAFIEIVRKIKLEPVLAIKERVDRETSIAIDEMATIA